MVCKSNLIHQSKNKKDGKCKKKKMNGKDEWMKDFFVE